MQAIRSGVRLYCYKNNRQTFSQGTDGYFLCLILLTRVIIAQSMITKANKSLYVTYISTIPFPQGLGTDD